MEVRILYSYICLDNLDQAINNNLSSDKDDKMVSVRAEKKKVIQGEKKK
jgi:hypothetical protein